MALTYTQVTKRTSLRIYCKNTVSTPALMLLRGGRFDCTSPCSVLSQTGSADSRFVVFAARINSSKRMHNNVRPQMIPCMHWDPFHVHNSHSMQHQP